MRQIKPCPHCGVLGGWWSPLNRKSMVFRNAAGEKTEHRIFESKRKHCSNCDMEISEVIK